MIGKILLSLGITALVSILFGFLFLPNFWIAFTLAFILQLLFFYFFNSIYENRLIAKAQQLKLEEFKELNKHIVTLECPCDEKTRQDVTMRFDKDVIYECSKCKKNIKASTNIRAVQTTEPIYFNDRS